jgi:hypothetical protein
MCNESQRRKVLISSDSIVRVVGVFLAVEFALCSRRRESQGSDNENEEVQTKHWKAGAGLMPLRAIYHCKGAGCYAVFRTLHPFGLHITASEATWFYSA